MINYHKFVTCLNSSNTCCVLFSRWSGPCVRSYACRHCLLSALHLIGTVKLQISVCIMSTYVWCYGEMYWEPPRVSHWATQKQLFAKEHRKKKSKWAQQRKAKVKWREQAQIWKQKAINDHKIKKGTILTEWEVAKAAARAEQWCQPPKPRVGKRESTPETYRTFNHADWPDSDSPGPAEEDVEGKSDPESFFIPWWL